MSEDARERTLQVPESSEGTEEYLDISPGFASFEPSESAVTVNIRGRVAQAHYAGMTEDEAAKLWESEILCLSCLSAGVCRHANGIHDSLVSITRCLAYIPSTR